MEENSSFDKLLSESAHSMPEYDVPERVTQNVLNSVQSEYAEQKSGLQLPPIALLALLACLVLVWNSFDSVSGWGSWFVGVLVLWGFERLFESGEIQERKA